MSETNPGHGWWQATDGRWYPPELRREHLLERSAAGATVLTPAPPSSSSDGEEVGGPIQAPPTLHLGRPPGTENRPAGWMALAGAALMLTGALLPWATQVPGRDLGWRDADGERGAAWLVAALAITVGTFAVRCFAGASGRAWRAGLALMGVGVAGIALVEAWRIHQAVGSVAKLSGGSASLDLGPGLVVVGLGACIVLLAAAAFRSDSRT